MLISKMRKSHSFSLILLTFFFLSLSFNLAFSQKRPQEEVTVTAVEVPVRALHNGKAVKDLTEQDFEIFENGIPQEITAFEVISRRISFPQEVPAEEIKGRSKKRLFILIFNVFDYNEAVGEGIDDFFKNYFHKGDSLVVIAEDRILNLERGKSLSETIQNLKLTLKKYKEISTHSTLRTFRELGRDADRLLAVLRGDEGTWGGAPQSLDQAMIRFFEHYQRTWKDYRQQFILPDVNAYRSIIRRIKPMEGEKWAICFQQREMFPKLKNASRLDNEIRNWADSQIEPAQQVKARLVQAKQAELQRSFDFSENLPSEGLRALFMEANITFHLILLRSLKTALLQDFELRAVAQDYEDCFRQISLATGGSTAFSNKIAEALKEAAETEDHHYILVYSPKDTSGKARDIQVKVSMPDVDVIYLKQIPEMKIPPIMITDFEARKKKIKFSIINYKMSKIKDKLTGITDVKITIFDDASKKVFDQGKTLNLFKKDTHISLNFRQLKSGSYFIIIQAVDKISQEIDVFSSAIDL